MTGKIRRYDICIATRSGLMHQQLAGPLSETEIEHRGAYNSATHVQTRHSGKNVIYLFAGNPNVDYATFPNLRKI